MAMTRCISAGAPKPWLVKRTLQDRNVATLRPRARINGRASAELLGQMRKKWTSALHCLKCGKTLQSLTLGKTQLFACLKGHGAWVHGATLDSIRKS